MFKLSIVPILMFIAFTAIAQDSQLVLAKESQADFYERVIIDNSPLLSEKEVSDVLKVINIDSSERVINHPEYGQIVVPGIKKLKRIEVEKKLLGLKINSLCGTDVGCRTETQQCAGKFGYIENNKIKTELHQCINAIKKP